MLFRSRQYTLPQVLLYTIPLLSSNQDSRVCCSNYAIHLDEIITVNINPIYKQPKQRRKITMV